MSDYSTQKSQKIIDKSQKNPTKEPSSQINSRSNSFLRSLKSSKLYKSSETELEEGETISPSPSPRHTSIKVPDKSKDTARRESTKEKERSPNRHTSSRRREDNKRSNARQDHRSSRHDSDNDSGSRRRSSPDRKRDKSYRSSRYHSRSRSTSRSRTPPSRRSRNRSSDAESNRSESSRRRSPLPPTTATATTSRSEKSNTNGSIKNSDNDSHSNKRKRSPREKRDQSTEKSGTPSRTLTPTSSSLSHVKETNDRNTKPKTISATAPDSDTPEQCKLFIIMFGKLAHANKRRGDTQTEEFFGMIDHFHALCDYILNFYYVDKTSADKVSFKQASQAWKSLFPFTDSLLAKLESHQHFDLYGLCARLISLVRYYIYKRMIDSTRHLLRKQLALDGEKDASSSRVCIQVSEGLLREYEKAERWYRTSEKYLSYGTMATQFPQTFKHVCIEGDLSAGITLGGEAGVSVEPMFPFTPYSPLHHAAIVSKCMLSEYVRTKKFDYSPISQPEEYMK
ncbi:unnamed protein product [Mucor circinelloides]